MPDGNWTYTLTIDGNGHLIFAGESSSGSVRSGPIDLGTFRRPMMRAMADLLAQQDFGEQPGDEL